MSEVTRHEMPNGQVVFYRDKDHSYFETHNANGTCSGRIPGISSVAKLVDVGADPLIDWGSRLTCEGVARELEKDGIGLADPDWTHSGAAIWERLRGAGLTWRQIREEAGFRGADAHGTLERLCRGEAGNPQSGYEEALCAWWAKRDPTVLQCEQVVYCPEPEFAGRFDLRAEIDGMTWLVDLKTSGYIARSFHFQLAGYEYASIQSGFGASDRELILQVREDGTWREIPCEATVEDFLLAAKLDRRGKAVDAAARRAAKVAVA